MKKTKIDLFVGISSIVALLLLLYQYAQDKDLMWLVIVLISLILCVETFGRYFLLNGGRFFKIILFMLNVGILFLTFAMGLERMNAVWPAAGVLYFIAFLIRYKKIYNV